MSIFLLLLTETCSISWICKYSNLLPSEWQTLRRWFATPHLTLPVLMSLLWILNLSLKLIAEPMYCFPQHLHDINYIAFLEVHFKIILTLYLHLFSKQANSVKATTFSADITSFMEFFWRARVLIMNSRKKRRWNKFS